MIKNTINRNDVYNIKDSDYSIKILNKYYDSTDDDIYWCEIRKSGEMFGHYLLYESTISDNINRGFYIKED